MNDTWQGNMFDVTKITDTTQINKLITNLKGEHPFCVIDDKYFVVYKTAIYPARLAYDKVKLQAN